MIDRRLFLLSGSAALAGCMAPRLEPDVRSRLEEIRAGLGAGARLGLAALDTGSGRRIEFDAASRYAMCSTFKPALAAAILAEVDHGSRSLSDTLPVTRADLVDHAPRVTENLERGRM